MAQAPLGATVAYTLLVGNHGPGAAADVIVNDQASAPATLRSAHPSQGSCSHSLPLKCLLGTLAPGAHATIAVRIVPHRQGLLSNTAVLGTSSLDPAYAGLVASARVRIGARPRRRRLPSFTG